MKEVLARFDEISEGWLWPLVAAQLEPGFTKDDIQHAILHATLTYGRAIMGIKKEGARVVYKPTGVVFDISFVGDHMIASPVTDPASPRNDE